MLEEGEVKYLESVLKLDFNRQSVRLNVVLLPVILIF